MRAGFVVSGVLGVGTVLVFAAAALVSALLPNGTTVAGGWNGGVTWDKGGGLVAPGIAVPAPMDGGQVVMPEPAPAEK
ncbi:MAG: hypothetical protein ACYC65_01290 [Candidatus Limnocylindrales bacterium]